MSNAQYEPQDVLDRLGVKLLRASPNDRGWEVFSLDYKVDAPLQPVIHAEVSCLLQGKWPSRVHFHVGKARQTVPQ